MKIVSQKGVLALIVNVKQNNNPPLLGGFRTVTVKVTN